MKDADGNVGFAEYTLTVSTGTGLKDYQQEAIRVWGDHGAIEVSTSTSNCRVMIFDLSGRLVIQNRLKGNDRYTVDNGIYTVVVEDARYDRIPGILSLRYVYHEQNSNHHYTLYLYCIVCSTTRNGSSLRKYDDSIRTTDSSGWQQHLVNRRI